LDELTTSDVKAISTQYHRARVKPHELLAETRTPEGDLMTLLRHGGEYIILANGKPLMSSRMHGSEEALAALGCRWARTLRQPCVLVGGLGMGFTLRATLDLLPPEATLVVTELLPSVVEWNRGVLGPLADHPLKDRRVRVEVGDVAATLRSSTARFDAVLLDVDNGPDAFTAAQNAALYADSGLAAIGGALKDGGVLAVWSAWEDRKFEQRLRYNAFTVDVERVRGRLKKGGPRHTIFVGRYRAAAKQTRQQQDGLMSEHRDPEEEEFRRAMGDVVRLPLDPRRRLARPAPARPSRPAAAPPPASGPVPDDYVAPGIDRREIRRLRRGEHTVRARLDLHGVSVGDAGLRVTRFIENSRHARHRCVCIIHGKGLNSAGGRSLLREPVRDILMRSASVLAFATAPSSDGGAGAVYVLLRR
jgi:DNA-nicking Smr family endonuclease